MKELLEKIKLDRFIKYKLSKLKLHISGIYGVYCDVLDIDIIEIYGMTVDIYITDVEKYFGIKYNNILHNKILKFIDKDESFEINLKETLPYDEHHGYIYVKIKLDEYERINKWC